MPLSTQGKMGMVRMMVERKIERKSIGNKRSIGVMGVGIAQTSDSQLVIFIKAEEKPTHKVIRPMPSNSVLIAKMH